MPALFAYLVAVGLLLGGGYGALNWLAAPEPIKAAAKAKPKPAPRYAASPEASPSEPNSLSINDGEHTASASNIESPSPRARMEASEQATRAMPLTPPQDEQSRSADKVFSPPEPKQRAEIFPVNDATQGAAHPAQAVSSTADDQATSLCLHRCSRASEADVAANQQAFGKTRARPDDLAHHRISGWPSGNSTDSLSWRTRVRQLIQV